MKLSKLFKKLVVPGCIAKDRTNHGGTSVFCKVTKLKYNRLSSKDECWGYWYKTLENVKKDIKNEEREMFCTLELMDRVI